MATISSLVDPKIFVTLSERDIEIMTAVIEGEVATNPAIHKILRERLDQFEFGRKPATKPTK